MVRTLPILLVLNLALIFIASLLPAGQIQLAAVVLLTFMSVSIIVIWVMQNRKNEET